MTLTKKCEARRMNASDIYLDPWNPRTGGLSEGIRRDYEKIRSDTVQAKCKEMLIDSNAKGITDLLRLMKAHGFETADRMITVEFPDDPTKVLAFEGNRRTAASKQLIQEIEEGEFTYTGDDAEEKLGSLDKLEVLVLPKDYFHDDNIRWQAQGLRHHEGSVSWSPMKRHQHIRKLHERMKTPSEIADIVGKTTGEVNRILMASWRFDAVRSANTPYKDSIGDELYNYFADEGWSTKLTTWTKYDQENQNFGNLDNLSLILQMVIDEPRQCSSMIDLRDNFTKLMRVDGTEDEEIGQLRDETNLTINEALVRKSTRLSEQRSAAAAQRERQAREAEERAREEQLARERQDLERTPSNHVRKLEEFTMDLPSFSWVVGEHSIIADTKLAQKARNLLFELRAVCGQLIEQMNDMETDVIG